MPAFTVRKQQQEKFVNSVVRAVVTGSILFTHIENPHLVEACSGLGVRLPCRKTLAKKHIPALAAEANSNNTDLINKAKLIDAPSDGWRRKECKQGAALNNRMALLHDKAGLHDAINVSVMRNSALAIKQF
jgi:hypothetical protein